MKKYLLVAVLILGLLMIYYLFFTKQERKARKVRQNVSRIMRGVPSKEVKKILSDPDTIYYYDQTTQYGDGVLVLQYYQGFGAPDVLRILTRKDTVVDLISNN